MRGISASTGTDDLSKHQNLLIGLRITRLIIRHCLTSHPYGSPVGCTHGGGTPVPWQLRELYCTLCSSQIALVQRPHEASPTSSLWPGINSYTKKLDISLVMLRYSFTMFACLIELSVWTLASNSLDLWDACHVPHPLSASQRIPPYYLKEPPCIRFLIHPARRDSLARSDRESHPP